MGQLVSTLGDLISSVIIKVENRTTDTDRVTEWLVDAISEITSNPKLRDDFDELEVQGMPFVNLAIGIQEYNDSLFMPTVVPTTTANINMGTLDIRLWQDPPTNNTVRRLDWTTFQETDKYTASQSQPTKVYRYGGKLGFYPIPDKTYQTQARALQYYPFVTGTMAQIRTTPFILAPDWVGIIKQAAAELGFMELEEYEKAAAIHKLLHGDSPTPSNPDPEPGLLYSRKKRRDRENWRQEQRLMPVVRPYSYGGRC